MSSYGTRLAQALEQRGTPASDDTLVTGASGTKVAVAYIYVSSSVAGTVTVESGASTRKFELYVAEDGGATATAPEGQYLFLTAAGESLTWTSDISGSHFISVLYQKVS